MAVLAPTLAEPEARFELHSEGGEALTLRVSGTLNAHTTARLWRELDAQLPEKATRAIEVDASAVQHCDGAGLALLHFLEMSGMTPPCTT